MDFIDKKIDEIMRRLCCNSIAELEDKLQNLEAKKEESKGEERNEKRRSGKL